MAEFMEKAIRKIVEDAVKEGIPIKLVEQYLKLTKNPKDRHKEIFDKLCKENYITKTDLARSSKEINLIIAECSNYKNIKGKEDKMEPENNNGNVKSKAEMLEAKIEELKNKCEQEPNMLKRHILSFKIRMLVAKIQKEIDLQNIKDSYEQKRTELTENKNRNEEEGLDKISVLNDRILVLRKEIEGNEEYDTESEYCSYPREYVKNIGGVDALVTKLRQSKQVESQQAAQRIEYVAKKRQQLEQLEDKLDEARDTLANSEREYNNQNFKYNVAEKAMVLKEKANIFARIGIFFTNIVKEVKEYRNERNALKEMTIKQNDEMNLVVDAHNQKMDELRIMQDEALQQLQQQQAEELEKFKQQQAEVMEKLQQQQENDRKDLSSLNKDELRKMVREHEHERQNSGKEFRQRMINMAVAGDLERHDTTQQSEVDKTTKEIIKGVVLEELQEGKDR